MIRRILPEDIPVCLDWYNTYIRESAATFETEELTLAEFTERVKHVTKKYPWIVLEEDGKLCGYAYLCPFNERAAYDWTADLAIYLDPQARGKKYGSALMEAILKLAERDGYFQIVSLVTAGNLPSEALHHKFGFEKAVTLNGVGIKFGKVLGVSYWVKTLKEPEASADPARPQDLDPE